MASFNIFHKIQKPILKSLQSDRSYLLLGLTEETVTLYRGTMGRLNLIAKTTIDKGHIDNKKEFISNWFEQQLEKNISHTGSSQEILLSLQEKRLRILRKNVAMVLIKLLPNAFQLKSIKMN